MPAIILLHGALGAQSQLARLEAELQAHFSVHRLDFDGHGGRPITAPFRIERFAQELKDYITQHQLHQAIVFGYSMGGYVALKLASQEAGLISHIITLGTKFDWSPESAARETRMLSPDLITEKVPKFADTLQARHAPTDWREVLHATAEMMIHLGDSPALDATVLGKVDIPCLILRGELDNMVAEPESQQAANALSQGRFETLSDAKHPIERVDTEQLATRIKSFLSL